MQHLDEGTIHSWLDGALSAEESARVEAHVAECPQCAAAVAEARGFIAASSRILTALDHVPAGVVPAGLPVKWYRRSAWRAAAAVLVVGVGSLIAVSNSERNHVDSPSRMASAADSQSAVTSPQIMAASPGPTATSKLQAPAPAPPAAPRAITSRAPSSIKPTSETGISAKRANNTESDVVARERVQDQAAGGGVSGYAAAPVKVPAVVTAPQSALSMRVAGVSPVDSASGQPLLKVVATPRMIGAKVTLYEVAPGDTVTFTEPSNLELDAVVVTGMSSTVPQARRSVQKSAVTPSAQIPAPSHVVPPLKVEVANGVTTISWPDVTTGNLLKLSGRMSVDRLKEIKLRIERERVGEAARKKP